MRSLKQFDPKYPSEILPITFDFAKLGAVTLNSATVAVEVVAGTDPDVADMLLGTPVISGQKVTQLVRAGVSGATYSLRADVTSGDAIYALAALLPVES